MAKKHSSLGVVFNDGSIKMFYAHDNRDRKAWAKTTREGLGDLMI